MRAAEIFEPQRFRIVDHPQPKPGPGEVLVRVAGVGICGSDLHWFTDEGVGRNRIRYPAVLGHEPTGEILATGDGVTGWGPGDRAALEPAIYCYHCEHCHTGNHNVCANGRFLSSNGEPGYFREFVAIPASNLLPLPAELSWGVGTLFEPLAVILNAMDYAMLRPGETAAIYGAGPIGLLTLAMLKLSGVGRVWVVEPARGRQELALAMGADAVVDPGAEDPVARIRKDTGNRGVDITLDCATKEDTISQSIHTTRNAGRVLLLGIYTGERVSVDFHAMRNRELRLQYIHRAKHRHGPMAIEILRSHSGRFAPMITHTLPLERIQHAFEVLEDKSEGVGKVVISL